MGCLAAPSAGAPAGWEAERRLSSDAGASRLSFNFARAVAADEERGVHVVWFDQRVQRSRVLYRRSTDGGRTWRRALSLSSPASFAEQPAIAASGRDLFVVWHARGSSQDSGGDHHVVLRRSADGGASWRPALRLSTGHAAAHPAVSASGDAVHVSWVESRGPHSEMVVRSSPDRGASWGPEQQLSPPGFASWVPTVDAEGDLVVGAWVDTRDGNEEEYLRRSLDGGASWDAVVRLTADDRNSWAPSIAVDGRAVHVAWFDQRDAPFSPYDAEATLDQALRLLGLQVTPAPGGVLVPDPDETAMWRAGEKLRLVEAAAPAWVAAGGEAARLQAILCELRVLGEGGANHLTKERKIDEAVRLLGLTYAAGPSPGVRQIYYGDAMAMRVQDKLLQVQEAVPAWVRNGGDPARVEALLHETERRFALAQDEWEVYYLRSPDAGATWEAPRRLSFAPRASQRPSLAVDGDRVWVAWFDRRDGDFEIYVKGSADGGASWGDDVRLSDAPGVSQKPSLAMARGVVHLVWSDDRTGNEEIFYTRSR